jgi:hypothetical protein
MTCVPVLTAARSARASRWRRASELQLLAEALLGTGTRETGCAVDEWVTSASWRLAIGIKNAYFLSTYWDCNSYLPHRTVLAACDDNSRQSPKSCRGPARPPSRRFPNHFPITIIAPSDVNRRRTLSRPRTGIPERSGKALKKRDYNNAFKIETNRQAFPERDDY